MKKPPPDISWLSRPEEWDFRSVTKAECRIACHWEYARDIEPVARTILNPRFLTNEANSSEKKASAAPEPRAGTVRGDAVTKSALFPKPWVTLSETERAGVVGAVEPLPPLQVRTLVDFLSRGIWPPDLNSELMQRLAQGVYVIRPNFSGLGVEVIIREFERWARKEAKEYAQSPRAKAAGPPFDLLKWLAVYRLEEKRREAGITYEKAHDALREYQRLNRKPNLHDVFPVYASHGAWSKARRDASRIRAEVIGDSAALLRDCYLLS
jgi:hypothetical protein